MNMYVWTKAAELTVDILCFITYFTGILCEFYLNLFLICKKKFKNCVCVFYSNLQLTELEAQGFQRNFICLQNIGSKHYSTV